MRSKLNSVSGVSMLEMIVVVVLIGILAAITVPNFGGAIRDIKFKNFARELQNTMRYARSAAVTLQIPHGVYFDQTHHQVLTFQDKVNPGTNVFETGDSVVRVDTVTSAINFVASTFANNTVVFSPDGSANESGMLYCHSSDRGGYGGFMLNLVAATGRCRVEVIN